MKKRSQTFLILGSLMALLLMDGPTWLPVPDAFVGEANAIIGRPITPVSYAGVARRSSNLHGRTSSGAGPVRLTAGGDCREPAAFGVRIEPSE